MLSTKFNSFKYSINLSIFYNINSIKLAVFVIFTKGYRKLMKISRDTPFINSVQSIECLYDWWGKKYSSTLLMYLLYIKKKQFQTIFLLCNSFHSPTCSFHPFQLCLSKNITSNKSIYSHHHHINIKTNRTVYVSSTKLFTITSAYFLRKIIAP